MAKSDRTIETLLTHEISQADALAIAELLVTVWPRPGVTLADRAEKIRVNRGDANVPDDIASRSLVVRDGHRVIGHALIFPRTIGATSGDITIAGLASVCTAAELRGQRLGEALVHAAWQTVDAGRLPFSLFQTSQRASTFYKRLGACAVDNRIFSSLADQASCNPFSDDRIMRYPADRPGWPDGDIDLRGPGY